MGDDSATESLEDAQINLVGEQEKGSVPNFINDEEIPKVGMSFGSPVEALEFYKNYARKVGFTVKKRSTTTSDDKTVIINQSLACTREGWRPTRIVKAKKMKSTSNAKCSARMHYRKCDEKWVVTSVVLEHTHPCSPKKVKLFSNNKGLNMHHKHVIEINDQAEVKPNKSFQALVQAEGVHSRLNFLEKNTRNFINTEVRDVDVNDDARGMLKHFMRMKQQNQNFFYEVQVDENNSLKNIFWVDARGRAAFEYFGDVVSFDTTYNTNKYDMLFGSFVGVNHHGKSILLGCALLRSEDVDTFSWLFERWMECMYGKQPKGILTNQCKAMKIAIERTLPSTRHRWCIWHILKKIPENLGGCKRYNEFKPVLIKLIWESRSTDVFERCWLELLEKFSLHANTWLSDLYNERHRWVPIFMENEFWAGMRSTQRSESMHNFFDKYLTRNSSLTQFVKQYDNALADKELNEYELDIADFKSTISCFTTSSIEVQFQEEYTHSIFRDVQDQFRLKVNCATFCIGRQHSSMLYKVVEQVHGLYDKELFVEFNTETHMMKCQCLLFESKGILCCHCLCVLSLEQVEQVPSAYILTRWSKNVKRRYSTIRSTFDNTRTDPQLRRYDALCSHFYDIAKLFLSSDDVANILHRAIDSAASKLRQNGFQSCHKDKGSDDMLSSMVVDLHSPPHLRFKGRP